MPHPLQVTIASLRRRVQRLLWLHGISRCLTIAVATIAVLALLDAAFRYEERGIRIASSLTAAAVAAWGVWRFVRPVWQTRFSDVYLARQIERRNPLLHERLAGAVAFLGDSDDDPRAGSLTLRRLVIHETTQDALRVPLNDVVRPKPVYAAAALALTVCAVIAGLAAWRPESARIAALRLARPWANDAWPQTNHLKFVEPVSRLALGRRFSAELIDAGGAEIPGEVQIIYRLSDDPNDVERRPMHLDGGVWTAERPNVERDFAYRAVGGDDRSMPWHEVQVVEPPSLREVRWKATYPDYAHWTPLDTGLQAADRRPLSATLPLGTKLELWARVNKPLRSASLSTESGQTLAAVVDADRLGFSITAAGDSGWEPKKNETFRFELVGDDGFIAGEETRQEVYVEPDPAPWVKLEQPQGSPENPRGDIFVTPSAVLPVRIAAGDAFAVRPGIAVRQVALNFSRSDKSAEPDVVVSLYSGPDPLQPAAAAAAASLKDEELRTVDHSWDLKPLALPPGTFVSVFADVRDYAGQQRASEARRLRVVAPDEFLERLNERQRALHAALNDLRDKQDKAQQHAAAAEAKSRDEKADADGIRRELTEALDLQREIAAALAPPRGEQSPARPDGIRNRVARMLEDLRNNRVDNREVESRLSAIESELKASEDQGKPQKAADELAEAAKNDPADAEQRRRTADAVAAAGEKQAAVRDALEAMLQNLAQWDGYGKFQEEFNRIRREQEQIAAETAAHLQRGLKPNTAVDPQQAEREAAELGAKQSALARRTEALQQQMRRSREQEQGQAADALDRALEAAGRENPAEAMRDAGKQLAENRTGQVPTKQQEALDKLNRVLEALSASKVDELNGLVAKLRESERDLAKMAAEQRSLQKKLRDAADIADEAKRREELQRLGRQQRELQKKAEEMAERLRRLKAQRSAERMDRGGQRMKGAGQGADQDDAADAAEQAEAAARDLENAQQELAEERRQAEADLAREAATRLVDELKAALVRQQRVVDETRRYDALNQAKKLTRAAAIGLIDLAREQEALAEEARAFGERLASAAAFKLALDGAASDMTRAAQLLRERRTDDIVQRAENAAIRRYTQLLDALQPRRGEGKQPGGGQEGGESGAGQGGGSQSGDDSPSLSELVLIKLMQEDVNSRTKELDEAQRQGALTPDQRREFEQLSEEQGRLADLLLNLLGKEADSGADDAMPELKPDDLKSPRDTSGAAGVRS